MANSNNAAAEETKAPVETRARVETKALVETREAAETKVIAAAASLNNPSADNPSPEANTAVLDNPKRIKARKANMPKRKKNGTNPHFPSFCPR